ncbi:MAG: ABC transporter permease [Candidatus Odinarchaeota archaeon]
MGLKRVIYKIRNKLNLQFIKHTWLNLKRDRAKALFAILGIMISIVLLTAIGMVNDTMSYNYMQIITSSTGNADIMISKRIKTDISFSPYFDEDIIDNDLQDIEGVEEFFPRIMMLVRAFSNKSSTNSTLELYGLDFLKEASNGHMGDLVLVDENGLKTGTNYLDEPVNGECVILWRVAELLNLTVGDFIHLEYLDDLDLEVVAICEQELKFTELENSLILVNIQQAQSFLVNGNKEINFIYGTLESPETIYDIRNVDETKRKLREIGTLIQSYLDINEFSVSMPKLEEIGSEEFMLIAMTVIFWFITIIGMLITGILINSILSTSTEERVREYGILRVVGGKKTFPVKVVVFEGALIGTIGSLLGIIIGLIFTPPIVNFLFVVTGFPYQDVEYIIQPQTILLAFSIGAGGALAVSVLPALKTAKMNLIKSITPFHAKEEGWEVKKEGSVNVKSFLVGISIATIGMVVFILLPTIFVSGEFMLIAGLFIGLLGAILIGLVFASVGIVPLIQQIFLGIIKPTIRKYANIIKISLKRNRRRNTSTIVMFAISFSFIFFITSVTEMESENMSLNLRFQYGSDLVLINQGLEGDPNAVTSEMAEEIKILPGVDDVAITLYNMFDITSVLSIIYDFSEGGMFDEETLNEAFLNVFEFYTEQSERKYKTRASDLIAFEEFEVGLIGIEEDFIDLVDKNLIIWNSPGSGNEYSFNQLFNRNDTCIISGSLATVLGIKDIGEQILISFYENETGTEKGDLVGDPPIFTVVGISGGIPGFWNFRSSVSMAAGSGLIVSLENYMRLMDIENPGSPDMTVDKIFINLLDVSEENIEETKEDIQTSYEDKDFFIDDAISKIIYLNDMYERQSTLMEVINWFAIAIAVFGLISSMYAVMLERKFEIGILRSVGMKVKNVRKLFLIESMILMLSSGAMGTIIGVYCAYLLETNMALMTELPIVFEIPIDVLLRVYFISILVGFIGMYIILIRLSRQTIMDIFRQTF